MKYYPTLSGLPLPPFSKTSLEDYSGSVPGRCFLIFKIIFCVSFKQKLCEFYFSNSNNNKVLVPKLVSWLWIHNRLIGDHVYSSLYLNHSILSNIILPITYLINISLLLLILFRPSSTSFSSLNLDQIIFAVTFLHNPWHAIDVFVRLSECCFKNRSCLCCTLLMLLYAIIVYTWGVSYSTVLYLIYASNFPPKKKEEEQVHVQVEVGTSLCLNLN